MKGKSPLLQRPQHSLALPGEEPGRGRLDVVLQLCGIRCLFWFPGTGNRLVRPADEVANGLCPYSTVSPGRRPLLHSAGEIISDRSCVIGAKMKTRQFGHRGPAVPVIGQGTWNMEQDDRREVGRALRRGLDLGMTHLDTAEMYGAGVVERIVGEAIAGRRNEVFLASKVLPEHASYKGTLQACESSLKRLGTDYLDLYLLHWAGRHPLSETIRAFEQLVSDGKIRMYGVSNFDAREVEEAVRLAGPGKIACNQVLYHLRQRGIEHEVIPTCKRHNMAVVGYSPFGSGRFPAAHSACGRILADIAARHNATPRQIALAYLVRVNGVFAIPKAARVTHVEENAAASDLSLPEADLRQLDRAFPRGPRPRELPSL